MRNPTPGASPRLKARIAGAIYLVIFIVAPAGAATATAARMVITLTCDTGVALIFYSLFKPVSRNLSMFAAIFRLILVAIMAVSSLNYFGALNLFNAGHSSATFNRGEEISLVPFGIHCLLIGYLIFRSSFLPRILGVLMMFAGLGWVTFLSPAFANHLYPYILAPGILGEGALTLWLLVMGLNEQRWREQARAAGLLSPEKANVSGQAG
ncbi:MAG TPA: DUF4386 domain-containing protein [Verrucomicrobiae bacterium]|nr:DUF4386 domain-containing protein [Verrucomicrobiae bacterium]